jgi:hypothetical protein
MSDKYILNADHSLRQTDDLEEWAQAFEGAERCVARTEAAPGIIVSTVFLGIDHSFGHGVPLVFETMIFRNGQGDEMWRYSTWEEAEAGHEAAVKLAASCDTRPEGGDSTEIEAPFTGGAVGVAETPKDQSCVSTEPIVE